MRRFSLYLLPFAVVFGLNAYWLLAGSGSGKAFPAGDEGALLPYGIFLLSFAALIYKVKQLLHRKLKTP